MIDVSKIKRVFIFSTKKLISTAFFTVAAGLTLWTYAAFTEPAAGPASSTQDFTQNALGANNADNAYASPSVVANADGSILERLEFITSLTAGATCGNGVKEKSEGCDDGNTSWTTGTCAGDCSRLNYWSNPTLFGIVASIGYNGGADRFCQGAGFALAGSSGITQFNSTLTTSTAASSSFTINCTATSNCITRSMFSTFHTDYYYYNVYLYDTLTSSTTAAFTASSRYVEYATDTLGIKTYYGTDFQFVEVRYQTHYVSQVWCAD